MQEPIPQECMDIVTSSREAALRAGVALSIIQSTVEDLLAGPWMPTPDTIRAALYPSTQTIEERMRGMLGDDVLSFTLEHWK